MYSAFWHFYLIYPPTPPSWHWVALWNVLLVPVKTGQRERLPDFEIIQDTQVPRDHYSRSTKSRIKKEAQNLPEEGNSLPFWQVSYACSQMLIWWHCPEIVHSIQPTSGTWTEMAEPSQRKGVSKNNPGPGTGAWALVPIPPLTLTLSLQFVLPCSFLICEMQGLNTTIFLNVSVHKYLVGHLLYIQISTLLPWTCRFSKSSSKV